MSHTNRSLVVAYILLVGLPLLALVEVLKMGRTLAAPISVDGVWRMETETGHFYALPCGNLLSSVTNAPILISQSGTSLVLTLNGGSKAPARVLEGRIIKASFAPTGSSHEAGCSINRIFTLTATFDPKSDPRTLNGTLCLDGGASCAPVGFRAVRQPRTSGEALMPNLFTLVLQIAVVLAACRMVGALFRKLQQPRVVGEMFAGVMLGPSFLGWMAPNFSAYLFPASSLGFLNALSQIGVIVFMFLVGLGINPKELKKQSHAVVLTSHVSITAPFVLASFLALYLYPRLSDVSVGFTSFALFMGAAMSITAFPVLARILSERNLLNSRLGTVAIACAAVDDVTGWCILAYIVVLIRAAHSATSIWLTISGIAVFSVVMIYGVRRMLRGFERVFRKSGALSENLMALMLLLVLVSALSTESLGIHLLFGAFLMGAIMPKEHEFVRYVLDRFETITVTLLLPLFFAFTGLRTNIGLVKGQEMWMYCGLIILVATVGKLGGSTLASWLSGMPLREAAGLGTLMNTRGLMELVILNIGLDIKVISPALFSMMVMMALVTTFMTTPVVNLICPKELLESAADKVIAKQVSTPRVSLREIESSAFTTESSKYLSIFWVLLVWSLERVYSMLRIVSA